jgi:hypothetical protein
MSWGLPPKYELKHQFLNKSVTTIRQSANNALLNLNFDILSEGTYHIRAAKKYRMTFFSFFAFSRPRIILDVFITKSGRVTLNSKYNYGSMFGIAMNDRGKQAKELGKLMNEIKEITALNHQYNPIEDRNEEKSSTILVSKETYYKQ